MTSFQLIIRSLRHFWRTNVAVALGVAIATAVIGGALVVGDSVRASLRQMTLDRLGNIDVALTGVRFVREELAAEIAQSSPNATLAPGLVFVGGLEHESAADPHATGDRKTTRRAGQVSVYGLDERGWNLIEHAGLAAPTGDEVILGARTAEALAAAKGDSITLWLELPASVPSDTLLGQRDQEPLEIVLTVAAIAPESSGLSRLSLEANQQLPLTAFVNLATLQDRLELSAIRPNRRDPEGRPARINTILAAADVDAGAPRLTQELKSRWTPGDVGLRVIVNDEQNLLILDSAQMILEDRLAEGISATAAENHVPTSPVHVYLANWLRNAKDGSAYSMYSVVAGIDLLSAEERRFGRWEFVGEKPKSLGEREIIVNDWLAEDLKAGIGDEIRLGYHVVGSHGELPEEEATFTVAGIVKLAGPAADRSLTPQVKGITDVDNFGDWDQPFPMKLDEITKRDDQYWAEYRATPKAFVSLAAAQELWKSRYGKLTSIRLAPPEGMSAAEFQTVFIPQLMQRLDPAALGLAFRPVKAEGLAAATGSQDFTGLFVGFSFFLILAATILIGLLLRLGIEQRVRQWGLLGAIGFSPRALQVLMLGEGGLLAVLGGALGIPLAIGYARLMIYALTTWWIEAIRTTDLFLAVRPESLVAGLAISLTASVLAMFWAVRQLRSVSPREQLTGVVEPAVSIEEQRRKGRAAGFKAAAAGGLALLAVAASLAGLVPTGEAFSGLGWPVIVFFLAGILLLAASLWFLSSRLQADTAAAVRGHGVSAEARLGLRNASRQRTRSVLTAGLIASATFVIAAVAAGQINPIQQKPDKRSGNGGFTLVAESSQPILFNLNTSEGRKQLGIADPSGAEAALWSQMTIVPFRVNPGEDASCLNLFQARVPTILGTPPEMIERGGFSFANAGGTNPWESLVEHPGEDPVPVLGDMNTLQFSLKKGIGDEIPIPNPEQPEHRLQIAGMFNGAVFQGVLLMSDEQFQRLYPERKGYRYFLIDVAPEHAAAAMDVLESNLAPYGFDAEPVAERLARFLSVQNTYLSTFQTLGGLGLLLGTLGLATVMLRNVWERQAEIALLRAIGFSSAGVGRLILWENAFLLLWGLSAGIVSALVAMSPHLRTTGADVPWGSVALLFAAVFACGMVSAAGAIRFAVRVPIVATLRGE